METSTLSRYSILQSPLVVEGGVLGQHAPAVLSMYHDLTWPRYCRREASGMNMQLFEPRGYVSCSTSCPGYSELVNGNDASPSTSGLIPTDWNNGNPSCLRFVSFATPLPTTHLRAINTQIRVPYSDSEGQPILYTYIQ